MVRHVEESEEKETLAIEPPTAPPTGAIARATIPFHVPFFCGSIPFVVLTALGLIGAFATVFSRIVTYFSKVMQDM